MPRREASVPVRSVEQAYLGKVLRRLIPLLFFGILLGYIDRANIAYASLQMNADLGLTPTVYGWAAGLFFLGYFVFEIPGTMALGKLGAPVWMSFLVACWGVLAIAMAFVDSAPVFFVLRFLLGAAEAGFFPGTILYMNYWVPRAHRSRLGACFMIAVPLAMVVAGPVSGLILQWGGPGGLDGWRWMFAVEGAPCLVLAAILAWQLIDRPSDAKWLADEEKAFIAADRAAEEAEKAAASQTEGWRSLFDLRLALLCTVTFGGPAVATGVTFWLPQVMTGFGLSIRDTGFLSALPFAVAGAAMWFWGAHSDRTGERTWHLALPLLVAAIGLGGSLVVAAPGIKFVLLLVASLGMFSYLPVAWAASHQLFKGKVAPVGYAIISMSGALAGLVAPAMLGMLRQATGNSDAGVLALTAIALVAALGGLAFGGVVTQRARALSTATA
jgi:ACS family tartrate transporter-like MFS transporter